MHPRKKQNQQGLTLISLMVSIVIMLIGVLSSLKLHTNHTESVNFVRNSTTHNRLLMTALIVAQKELQGAGFGIVDASENDITTQFVPATSSTPATRSILWRLIDNGTVECRGLRESGLTLDGKQYRTLYLITSPLDCNDTSPLNTFAWNDITGNLGLWEIQGSLTPYIAANGTLFNFHLNKASCTASRLTAAAQHTVATISVPNTAELNGHVLPSNVVDLCLINVNPS